MTSNFLRTALAIIFLISVNAQAESQPKLKSKCINTSCFSSRVSIGSYDLPIRAVSRFRYYFFKVYDGALYYPQDKNRLQLGVDPLKLELVYLRNIERDDLVQPSIDYFQKHSSSSYEGLKERLDLLDTHYQSVKEGDRYSLEFVPGKGTTLSFNGEAKVTIPGDDFAREYLGIWLSNNTQAKSFRKSLVGQLERGLE